MSTDDGANLVPDHCLKRPVHEVVRRQDDALSGLEWSSRRERSRVIREHVVSGGIVLWV